jgi:hypothetical protein
VISLRFGLIVFYSPRRKEPSPDDWDAQNDDDMAGPEKADFSDFSEEDMPQNRQLHPRPRNNCH